MKNIAVIDLNVLVRALLTSGIDRAIYDAIKNNEIIPVFSPPTLANLTKVLMRPHLKLDLRDIKEFLEALRIRVLMVKPEIKITTCRDASDNVILETAIASNAKIIISNDPDLLILNPFHDISIVTPRQFLKIAKK